MKREEVEFREVDEFNQGCTALASHEAGLALGSLACNHCFMPHPRP